MSNEEPGSTDPWLWERPPRALERPVEGAAIEELLLQWAEACEVGGGTP